MGKPIIEQIIDCIKEHGEQCYMPSYKSGECLERYVVVKSGGAADIIGISSERPIYMMMLYIPKNQYSQLEEFSRKIKEALRDLYPMLMYAGNETASYYDESVKAHMISFIYQGIRKIKQMKGV